METLLVLLMIGAGGAGAAVLMMAAAKREKDAASVRREFPSGRGSVGAAILNEIALAGGASGSDAERLVAEQTEYRGAFQRRIDLTSWAESFARGAGEAERCELLESAVRLAVAMNSTLPPRQYHALLDLSFGLGFHADALARLRAKWRFEYADYARMSRPREADRGAATLFRRVTTREKVMLMKVLELQGELERGRLISAYRRLAGASHPDRFHDSGAEAREAAARKFIELTEAYEKLLALLAVGESGVDHLPGR